MADLNTATFAPKGVRAGPRVKSRRVAIAFHEAGHAVVAWRRGLKVHSATIVPTKDYSGMVRRGSLGVRLDIDGSNRARLRAESAIVVCLAGPAAQRRHNPRSWRPYMGASDHAHAADMALRLNGSQETTEAHLAWLALVARDEVAVLWPIIDKVAAALLEHSTLSASELKGVMRGALMGRAPAFSEEDARELLHIKPVADDALPEGHVWV